MTEGEKKIEVRRIEVRRKTARFPRF